MCAPGRTAAFDGLCCEIRGLGFEMTLGRIVDSFEPVEDKSCSTPAAVPPKTLEEEYQVSAVDTREEEGIKILEIPAGDYVPMNRPVAAPIITSITAGKNGFKPRVEISQEPIIDDIDDDAAYLSQFIDEETNAALGTPENPTPVSASASTQSSEQRYEMGTELSELSAAIAPELGSQQDKLLLSFPSLSDLQSLASELMNLSETVGVSNQRENTEGEKSHGESNYIMDDEES